MNSKVLAGSAMVMMGMVLGVGVGVSVGFAQSGNLEPPSSAMSGNGAPVATTQAQPSWDQVLPANERFKLVLNSEAVLDRETGLVWEQAPTALVGSNTTDTELSWSRARGHCAQLSKGGRQAWMLPSLRQLNSLVDPTNVSQTFSAPALPDGHPFSNIQGQVGQGYWTATTRVDVPTSAWTVSFSALEVASGPKTATLFVWCVRGGGPLSAY